MKHNTTFGGRSIARRRKAELARRIAVLSLLCAALAFAVTKILKEPTKEIEASLTSAEADFRTESGQSVIQMQIMTAQQQMENAQALTARSSPHLDYSVLISQAAQDVRQAQADLNVDFDNVSRLIDSLPVMTEGLRKERDQMKEKISTADEHAKNTVQPLPADGGVMSFVALKIEMVEILLQDIPVQLLGDQALTEARRLEWAARKVINFCNLATIVLGFLGFALAIYSVVSGLKIPGELAGG